MNHQRVLVVEDDDSYRELLVMALQDAVGVRYVDAYATGASAIAAIVAETIYQWPFLVVLDFHLPGMTGVTLLRKLHGLGYRGRSAVISNAATAADRAACEAAGAVFLYKPSRYGDLVDALMALAAPPDSEAPAGS